MRSENSSNGIARNPGLLSIRLWSPGIGYLSNSGSQCSRDIPRLEPQVAANRGSQSTERQANVVRVVARGDVQPRQGLQLTFREDWQVGSVTQEPQSSKRVECGNTPHQGKYQPAECRNQGEVPIHWPEDHVERCEQHHDVHNVDQIAGDVDTKQCFVRREVPGGFCSIAWDDEAKVDAIVRNDHDRHREQESKPRDSRSNLFNLSSAKKPPVP